MKRVVFLSDILFHSPTREVSYHRWVMDLIEPAVKSAIGLPIIDFISLSNKKGEVFDRDYFYELSSVYDVTDGYFSYEIDKISDKSWKYFFSFINQDDFILGVELGIDLRNVLTEKNITFINFWFHSFHLFDDMTFMLNTNNEKIYRRIKQYQIPQAKFELYTNITKKLLNNQTKNLNIEDNCCLFIGQTFQDKSVEKDGIFLNISYFAEKLENLSKKYSTIYYIPHPSIAKEKHPQIDAFLKNRPYIKRLENIPTYALLASPKVQKVIGISSSVLYEAQFFGKEIEYLYQPLFDIDGEFGLNEFTSVYNDYFNPNFWGNIFDGFFEIKQGNLGEVLFDNNMSLLRRISGSYHGYRWIDPNMKMIDKTNGLQTQIKNVNNQLDEAINAISILSNNIAKISQNDYAICIYRKIKTQDTVTRYLFGIPFFKRIKRQGIKRIYILGIKVYSLENS